MEIKIPDETIKEVLTECILEGTPQLNLDELAQSVIDILNLNSTSPPMVDSIYVGPLDESHRAGGEMGSFYRDGFFCPGYGLDGEDNLVSFLGDKRANERMMTFLDAIKYPYMTTSDEKKATDITAVIACFSEPFNAMGIVEKLSNPIPPNFCVVSKNFNGVRGLRLAPHQACLEDGKADELYLDFIDKLTKIFKERKPSATTLIDRYMRKVDGVILYQRD